MVGREASKGTGEAISDCLKGRHLWKRDYGSVEVSVASLVQCFSDSTAGEPLRALRDNEDTEDLVTCSAELRTPWGFSVGSLVQCFSDSRVPEPLRALRGDEDTEDLSTSSAEKRPRAHAR
jgi:hypothetical protein